MAIKILRGPEPPWGDYGDVLLHGMTGHLERHDGLLQLERTGPYIPPITFPGVGDIVVTDVFKRQLATAGFKGLSFRPVRKTRIVEVVWESWDRSADLPGQMPDSGEPEDFVLSIPHSRRVSELLGDLWEVVLPVSASVKRIPAAGHGPRGRIVVVLDRWCGEELFRADGVLYNYVSDRGQEWLSQEAGEHVTFEACDVE